ncbi:hypothetical protein Ancab_007860, partial [Ancistrocladus abbreviatus]
GVQSATHYTNEVQISTLETLRQYAKKGYCLARVKFGFGLGSQVILSLVANESKGAAKKKGRAPGHDECQQELPHSITPTHIPRVVLKQSHLIMESHKEKKFGEFIVVGIKEDVDHIPLVRKARRANE